MPHARHEALVLDAAVREQVPLAGREEVGLALEAQVLRVELRAAEARRARARAGSAPSRRRASAAGSERWKRLRRGGFSASTSGAGSRRWRDTRGPAGRDRRGTTITRTPRSRSTSRRRGHCSMRARAVDAAPRAPARARVRVRAALHAEVGRIAHQHRPAPAHRLRSRHPGRQRLRVEAARVLEVRLRHGAVERREDRRGPVVAAAARRRRRAGARSRRSCRGSS